MITLLSDFGYQDAYVAVMKGVIAAIAPKIPTCDITHLVPPQDILAARFNLLTAYPHFPAGTVHLAVVDPGVGSSRRAIALQTPSGFFVGPDNGLFSGIYDREPIIEAVHLSKSDYWRISEPSKTFHGRDIFAPVAAHLENGVPIGALGDFIDPATLVKPDFPSFINYANGALNQKPVRATGSLQYIDGFGNLITNIPGDVIPDHPWMLTVETPDGPQEISGAHTYSDVPIRTLVALVGSHGFVEVACNCGSALVNLSPSAQSLVTVGSIASLADRI
ncbi:MAG: SAM-dependent chlorinase/fluorinase [Cyanobacteria bacterium J06621_3]